MLYIPNCAVINNMSETHLNCVVLVLLSDYSIGYITLVVHDVIYVSLSVIPVMFLQFQQTPLHTAVQRGHIDVVKILLTKGADINAKDMVS